MTTVVVHIRHRSCSGSRGFNCRDVRLACGGVSATAEKWTGIVGLERWTNSVAAARACRALSVLSETAAVPSQVIWSEVAAVTWGDQNG